MDLNKVVSGLSSSGALSGFAGGLAGSALVDAISGKKGKKMAKGALKVGALAAVGGLAYTAYQKYTNNQSQAGAQATGTDGVAQSSWTAIPQQNFEAAVEDTGGSNAMLILRAMIAAASSDGHLDSEEQAQRINVRAA